MCEICSQKNTLSAQSAALRAMRLGVRDWWTRALMQRTDGDVTYAMTGPTGYVIAGAGVLWGMDLCLRYDWAEDLLGDVSELLSRLHFVVYTHSHEDHLDPRVLRLLETYRVPVVAPPFLRIPHVDPSRITRVKAGETYDFNGVRVTPFESLHIRPDTGAGAPEYGYAATVGDRCILCPGDIRDYRPEKLPAFSADLLFAHLWLGDRNAQNFPYAPYTDRFADFVVGLAPRRVAITHLYESGREADALWTAAHAGGAADAIFRRDATVDTYIPRPGNIYAV